METRILEESEYDIWDKLVKDSSQGTLFHTSRWLNNNGNLVIYGCYRNDELVGGCPLFIRDGIFRSASSTFDMCPYAGIVIHDSDSSSVRIREKHSKDVIGSLCDVFDKEQFSRIDIAFPPNSLVDLRPFIWDHWKYKLRFAYFFDLNGDINISKKARNVVNKAKKHDLMISETYDADIFYDLYVDTYKKQGQCPPMEKKFFKDTFDLIQKYNMGQMWIIEKDDIPLSAEIILWDNNDCFRWTAASNPEYKHYGGTTFLLFNVLKELKRLGFNDINLMGANTPHLAKFLSAFNPCLVSFHNIYKCSWFRDVLEYGYNKLKGK